MSGPDLLRHAMLVTAITVIAAAVSHSGSSGVEKEAPSSAVALNPAQSGGGVCYHTFVSEYVCPDSIAGRWLFAQDEIASVVLTVFNRAGQRRTITLPGGVDAIVFTKASAEKFLLPYYWATDPVKAGRLTRSLAAMR